MAIKNKSNNAERLGGINELFDRMAKQQDINHVATSILISKLTPFKGHPFRLYEGERLNNMVESVKANGIIVPVIVRPLDEENYEILSGHNRIEAAKIVGLDTVPAIIREDLSNDEALLIVTETNLIQRSFTDLSHSERAVTLSMHHEAIKRQGKRTDIINEIENLLKNDKNLSSNADFATSDPVGQKLNSREKTAQNYGLGSTSVARYLRINQLTDELKARLDNGEFTVRTAVDISYLPTEEQNNLNTLLNKEVYKLDMKKATQLRELSERDKLSTQIIEDILSGVAFKKKNRGSLPVQSLRIGGKKLSKYFNSEQKPEEIEAELFEALEFFREHKKI